MQHPKEQRCARPKLIFSLGIGRSCAISFAIEGCTRIVISDISSNGLTETHKLIVQASSKAEVEVIETDVSNPDQVTHLLERCITRFGRVDYAVNAAGCLGKAARSHELSIEDFDSINQVDYRGCWLCSREEIKHMLKQEPLTSHDGRLGNRGSIVNIASQLGIVARPGAGMYIAHGISPLR